MRDLDLLFAALQKSAFRRRFRLYGKELSYLRSKGLTAVLDHAADFVVQRLAPAAPPNDGRQTPWRGHPVFVAQHATATCCRGCLEKWHHIPRGHELDETEKLYVVNVLGKWLQQWETPDKSLGVAIEANLWEAALDAEEPDA
jgi:hypothetical protein